jgi:hypothetical protein
MDEGMQFSQERLSCRSIQLHARVFMLPSDAGNAQALAPRFDSVDHLPENIFRQRVFPAPKQATQAFSYSSHVRPLTKNRQIGSSISEEKYDDDLFGTGQHESIGSDCPTLPIPG